MKYELKVRTFVIPVEPSVADPAWQIACWENLNGEAIKYSDYAPILECVRSCEMKQAKNVGYSEAINDLCGKFGVESVMELYKLADKTTGKIR